MTICANGTGRAAARLLSWLVALFGGGVAELVGQEASFIVRLGRDTMAVEQLTRTPNRVTGEVASRLGAAVTRLQYEVTLNREGRAVTAVYRSRNASGQPLANQPNEIRLTFAGDSVKREAVFADSTNVRTLPAVRGVPFQSPAFGLYEVAFAQLRKAKAASTTLAVVSTSGANPNSVTFNVGGADTIRASNGVVYRVDREGKLLAVDASNTTQKLLSTRETSRVDVAAVASRMTPAGPLSPRGTAHGSFMQSVVFVSYGRPAVRERTVWGGVLIPFDTIWRAGANEATHLAVSRELTFGNVVVPPGLYTLFIYNARNGGPQLVINRQVGQWGTVYTQAHDLGRVPMQLGPTPEHVEDLTIAVRSLGGGRGALDFAWGNQVASAEFTAR
jgi:DUF2911 family protein